MNQLLSRPRKQRLGEIEIVRAAAIVAVVLIHATSEASVMLETGAPLQVLFSALNALSHFSVPVFVFVSGTVLVYRYADSWQANRTAGFFRRRLAGAAVPYLLWSGFYIVWNRILYGLQAPNGDASFWIHLLLTGGASYHLYFLLLILQYYLLVPVLLIVLKMQPRFGKAMIPLGLAGQLAYYILCSHYAPAYYDSLYFPTYLCIFMAGCSIGWRYEFWSRWISRHFAAIGLSVLAAGAAYVGLFLLWSYGDYPIAEAWRVLLVNGYSLAAGIWLLGLGQLLLGKRSLWLRRAADAAIALGGASFGIYLVHPAILGLFHRLVQVVPAATGIYAWYTWAGFALTFALSWLAVCLYRNVSRAFKATK